jgi:Cu/Ag efflux protein CusF
MKVIRNASLTLVMLTAGAAAWAAGAGHGSHEAAASKEQQPMQVAQADAAMADGEVRKIDKENKKITLKHGEIKSLEMPGMTMVFQVKDPAMLEKVKAGDKVRFAASKTDGALVVTSIEVAK